MANEKFRVYELRDAVGLPRFVGAARAGEEPPWRTVWRLRDRVPGRLAEWLRTLDREPTEKTLLGRGVALAERTAHALVKHRLAQIARMSGCPAGEWPDFIVNDRPCRGGGRGAGQHTRPVVVVEPDGTVRTFPSVTAAATAEGVARETTSRRVRRGLPSQGRTAL